MSPRKQRPPKTLSRAGKLYWTTVTAAYDFDDEGLTLLSQACEMMDRASQAAETIAKDGILQTDRFGVAKPHPATEIERQSRLAFARLRRELNLDVPPPDSRPPLPGSYR